MTSAQTENPNTWKVMISSLMQNCDAERRANEQAIKRASMLPMMSKYPEECAISPDAFCRQMAEECDLFLLILGPSYGFQPSNVSSKAMGQSKHLKSTYLNVDATQSMSLNLLDAPLGELAEVLNEAHMRHSGVSIAHKTLFDRSELQQICLVSDLRILPAILWPLCNPKE